GDVITRFAGRGYAARDHRRSPFGVHRSRSVSFDYGQGRGLQSSQTTWCWVHDRWSTCRWRNRRRNPGILLAQKSSASFGVLDNIDIRLLPIIVFGVALWPVLGTSYIGLPIGAARLVTLIGFALCVFLFERTLVTSFRFVTHQGIRNQEYEFSPTIGRRAFVLCAIGAALTGGGIALVRKLYRAA